MLGPDEEPPGKPLARPPVLGNSGNPMLTAFEQALVAGLVTEKARTELVARYGFAIPTDEALTCIVRRSPSGVVEIGAGCGYWADALHRHGVDVAAYDVDPPPSPRNPWFSGSEPWYPVVTGDQSVVERHSDRTLLVVWPTRNETWPADALKRYGDAGGGCVVYVGEPPGGRTGDDTFHALLGDLITCAQCEYRISTVPCICGVTPQWQRVNTVALPHWPGYLDDLHIYSRRDPLASSATFRGRRSRRR